MHSDAKDWFEQAEADLSEAKRAFEAGSWYACALFSQQAAEKALKALLIKKEKKLPPKIHDIGELARKCGAPNNITAAGRLLTPAYIYSRYPDVAPAIPVKYYTEEKAKHLLEVAEEVVQWIKQNIKY